MEIVARFSGIVHYAGEDCVIASRGTALFESFDQGKSWRRVANLPIEGKYHLHRGGRLFRRLLRATVNHVLRISEDELIVFGFGHVYSVSRSTSRVEVLTRISGSRPLVVTSVGRTVYYGEYRSNPERTPVHIWAGKNGGRDWRCVWTFGKVRHVHAVKSDPFDDALWVTVGDNDDEAAIYKTDDDFQSLRKILGGSQQTRAVDLLFLKDRVLFGSDAPGERNALYAIDRSSEAVSQLQPVDGPVFYGAAIEAGSFFGTVCEPSAVNSRSVVQMWKSTDGVKWEVFAEFRKDSLPMKLFQYGQLLFPDGPGTGNVIWVTPLAVRGDQRAICLRTA